MESEELQEERARAVAATPKTQFETEMGKQEGGNLIRLTCRRGGTTTSFSEFIFSGEKQKTFRQTTTELRIFFAQMCSHVGRFSRWFSYFSHP